MSITKISPSVVDFDSEITISTADNLTQLTLTSTDADASVGPRLDLKRDSSSPAADDHLGAIRWMGEDDAGNALSYAHALTYIEDPADGAEDGKFEIDTRVAGTMRSRLNMDSSATVFNEESIDVDFRIESDNSANALFVQGSDGKVGINVAAPARRLLEIQDASPGIVLHDSDVTNLTHEIVGGGNAGLEISADYQNVGTGYIRFDVGGSERARILESGNFNIEDGNLVVASGHGIDFSATGDGSGTDSSELLDDYEEGSWSPTISAGSVSGNQCQYTKVGNVVTLRGNLADITDNSTNGDIIITGLPYTAGSNNRAVGTAMFRYFSKTNAIHMNSYLGQNDSTLSFYWSFNSSDAWEVVEYDDGTQANMDIMFTLAYITT